VDSLVNIIETSQVACLFMIPGINETLRLNGEAKILTDQPLLNLFSEENNKPVACIKINIKEVFLHCAKAFMRSDLWGQSNWQSRPEFPTMGSMLNDQLNEIDTKNETQEEMEARYKDDL